MRNEAENILNSQSISTRKLKSILILFHLKFTGNININIVFYGNVKVNFVNCTETYSIAKIPQTKLLLLVVKHSYETKESRLKVKIHQKLYLNEKFALVQKMMDFT